MAFDDLTHNQIRTLVQLIEALNSGSYNDEFALVRVHGDQLCTIRFYDKGKRSVSSLEIKGFTQTDIQSLKEDGYITTSGGHASLKGKAFQQYKLLKDPLALFPTLEERLKHSTPSLDIFISHSSKDSDVAASLIELLRAALNISAERIRCTSVQGYKLKGGASTDETLRKEVHDAAVFIGLITKESLQSAYVLFELGARWGAGRHLLPVLASGTSSNVLRGPLTGINALRLDDIADIHQIVDDIAKELNKSKGSASAYQRHLEQLIEVQSKKQLNAEPLEKPLPSKTEGSNGREIDQVLYDEFREVLPSSGSIRFIKDYGVTTTPFDLHKLDDFDRFLSDWDDVEHEFIDKELEEKRSRLYSLIKEYRSLMLTNIFSAGNDIYSVPPEWKREQPDRFKLVVNELLSKEKEIVSTHQDLIRTAKYKLAT